MLSPSTWLYVVPMSRTVLVEAARLRVSVGLRLPDEIHVATATAAGCALFLTKDRRIRTPDTVEPWLLSDTC